MKPFIKETSIKRPLTGKNILITGASKGIGREAAIECAHQGATVILSGRNSEALDEVYDVIASSGAPEPAILELDLNEASEQNFREISKLIAEAVTSLHGFIHCASHITDLKPLRNTDLRDWNAVLRCNLIAPALIAQSCEPLFHKAQCGSVVLTSEHHAKTLDAYWGSYAISKVGLEAYSVIQSKEWSDNDKFRINVVTPGPIDSPLRSKTHPGEDRSELRQISSLLPTYTYLVSDASVGVNGENFTYLV